MKNYNLSILLVVSLLTASLVIADDSRSMSGDKAMMKHDALGNDTANTANNRRDRNLNTVLPEDQSNKQIFIDRTASIRRAVVARDDLSVTAKNIKIITLEDGVVVLRGPVKTAEEKTRLESIAKQFSGNSPVVSYLEF